MFLGKTKAKLINTNKYKTQVALTFINWKMNRNVFARCKDKSSQLIDVLLPVTLLALDIRYIGKPGVGCRKGG